MFTRVIESILTAGVAAVGGGFLAVAISTARIEEHVALVERRVEEHISVEREERKALISIMQGINDCLRNRTCTK